MEKDITLVRIYLSEGDHGLHTGLLDEIIATLHDEYKVHGVTVFRGIAGFGQKGTYRSAHMIRPRANLPVVVEFFDEPDIATDAIEALNRLVPSGHMIKWTVRCVLE